MRVTLLAVALLALTALAAAHDLGADWSEPEYTSLVESESTLPQPGQKCGPNLAGTCTAQANWCGAGLTARTGLCTGRGGVGAGFCCIKATPASTPVRPTPTPTPAASSFGANAVARAGTWVAAKLRYCQAPRGGRDASPECPRICVRQANPAWDAYRSDCSGLVSYAWGLPAPGVNTRGMSTVSTSIQCSAMRAGDAINRAGSHTMLFVRWVTPGRQAVFYEEPGCNTSEPYAREVTLDLTCSGSNVQTARRGSFVAVRRNGQ